VINVYSTIYIFSLAHQTDNNSNELVAPMLMYDISTVYRAACSSLKFNKCEKLTV